MSSQISIKGAKMKNVVFDYDAGDFAVDGLGAIQVVEDSQAVAHAAMKALHTERGKYEIYGNQDNEELNHKYGTDATDIVIRAGLPGDVVDVELKNAVHEALIFDPEIKSVDVSSVTRVNDGIEVTAQISTIYDTTETVEGVTI